MDVLHVSALQILIAGSVGILLLIISFAARKLRVPAPVLFLFAGVGISAIYSGADRALDSDIVVTIGTWALVFIIFEAGFVSGFSRLRPALAPVLALGVIGTLVSAAALAAASYWVLGLPLTVSILVAIALAPTDPATVFSALSGKRLVGRSGLVLEGEAGANDPVAIALMIGAIEWALHPQHADATLIAREIVAEMAVGLMLGLAIGYIANLVLTRWKPERSLYKIICAISCALLTYGIAAELGGSGFLAVFVAGLLIGEVEITQHHEVEQTLSLAAATAEMGMFLLLGLTVSAATLQQHWLSVIGLIVLMIAIRFAVVHTTLVRSAFTLNERHFIAWGGLRGAVPILLAALALSAHVEHGQTVETLVFWAVTFSVLIQGATLMPLARRFGLLHSGDGDEDDTVRGDI